MDCGKPPGIPGGNPVNITSTTYGSSFKFACDSSRGFHVTGASTLGNATVVCQSNGHWGYANLICEGNILICTVLSFSISIISAGKRSICCF